jgi:hypothetical protein
MSDFFNRSQEVADDCDSLNPRVMMNIEIFNSVTRTSFGLNQTPLDTMLYSYNLSTIGEQQG